jgi:hypothetical protein
VAEQACQLLERLQNACSEENICVGADLAPMAAAAAVVDWPTFGLLIPRIQALLDQSLRWRINIQKPAALPLELQMAITSAPAETYDLLALEGQSLSTGECCEFTKILHSAIALLEF